MKLKRIIIPTVTMVIIASQLFGCACSNQQEMQNILQNNGEAIEIEIATPAFEEQGEETTIEWVELAKNTEDESFRKAFELLLGITNENGTKNGIAYINLDGNVEQNNTLYNAFMNKAFVDNYWNNEEVQSAVAIAVGEHYADIEADSNSAKYSALYLYWSLLPDYEPNFANMGSSLTRAEAMTFIMRATTPVTETGVPNGNKDFTSLVGESDYTDYASYLDNKAFINTSDKSLNNKTFNGTMTKGEFIYLLINNTFGIEAINNVEIGNTKLNDCKDGGSSIEAQDFGNGDYSTSYKLVYAIQNPDEGAPTSMYKALVKANQLGIISAETAWDEALTREDAAELFVETMLAYSNINGSKVEADTGKVDENITKIEAEAKEAYATIKDSIALDEQTFINNYKDLILNKGYDKDLAIEEIKLLFDKEVIKPEPEAPVENPTEAPTENPTTNENEQKPTSVKEAYKLEPKGTYTEVEMSFGEDNILSQLENTKLVRRTYENGAIRDFIIVDGEEAMLDTPWGELSEGYVADPNKGAHVITNNKPTQPAKTETVFRGVFPPRSSYSSDEEWEAVVDAYIASKCGKYSGLDFSSDADAKLFDQLRVDNTPYEGDLDFANMSGEEWLKWCEEHGFTVN